MKRLFLILTLAVATLSATANDSTKTFLNQFKTFVESVEEVDSITDTNYPAIDSTYTTYHTRYRNVYRAKMSNDELSLYSEYRTRYNKCVVRQNSKKVFHDIDSVGNVVGKHIERGASKVGGFIRGLFKGKTK